MLSLIKKFRDPVSGLTHFIAFLFSLVALVLLVTNAAIQGTTWHIVAFAVFGTSLILLYGASSMYHLLPLSPPGTTMLRRIDHVMIFVLIAGTYTPVCLIPLRGVWGWSLFGIIWSMAIAGIFQALFWIHAPRWFSTSLYLVMGWIVIIAFYPLVQSIPFGGIIWFVLGGLCYTGGALIYALKRPNPVPGIFGFHEIWHLFVMAGSFCHFWAIFYYV
ncbi:MAG: hemolysin III family protein [Ignavibacteriales bacterium]|nr:hemolysin III family protein [Ignavibacteriales bacterium]